MVGGETRADPTRFIHHSSPPLLPPLPPPLFPSLPSLSSLALTLVALPHHSPSQLSFTCLLKASSPSLLSNCPHYYFLPILPSPAPPLPAPSSPFQPLQTFSLPPLQPVHQSTTLQNGKQREQQQI